VRRSEAGALRPRRRSQARGAGAPCRAGHPESRALGPKLRFELRREVLRRKALRTAALAGLQPQEMEQILKEREKEKGRKRCT
jgi:hypothetical protein